ncbi:carboxypeptidase-like regulatory domain-containing protein, partial [Fulvivirga sp. RKSG066]|uniref:carboxypeptidase-like regulatory domain-containing protein n=1 Tax=Fulvivirga aurantia TaxID=2529383 RepID=UPI0012BCAFF1
MRLLLLLVVLIPASFAHSQTHSIQGRVYDQSTKEPLPYVNVYLNNAKTGTVTNQHGQFKIHLREQNLDDTLTISYIGYKLTKIKIASISKDFECYLKEDLKILNELVFTGLSASQVIQKALANLTKNYPQDDYKSSGFYRLVSKKGNQYVSLSEAVFDIFHQSGKVDQFRLNKMRAIKDQQALKGIEVGLKPQAILTYDLTQSIKDWNILNDVGLKNHEFFLQGVTNYNNSEVYVISFDQKPEIKKSFYKGQIFIDKETFAFVYFDFGLSERGIKYHKYGNLGLRALMKLADIFLDISSSRYQIAYQKVGDKYYLNRVLAENSFSVHSSRENYDFILDSKVDYLVTNVQLENVSEFDKQEVLNT